MEFPTFSKIHKPQLFFLHFGGGNCYSYRFLFPYLERFDVVALELPGRGNRMMEPLVSNYEEAILDYYSQINGKMRSSNIVIFGHSMGATLGWEITKKLEENGIFPISLILSGNPGPGIITRKERYKLPRAEFIMELEKFGGNFKFFLENEELFNLFEPVLRADFEVLEKEEVVFNSVIRTPVIALMGSREEKATHINNWEKYCNGPFAFKIMEGDHFFIYQYPKELVKIIQMSYDKFAPT